MRHHVIYAGYVRESDPSLEFSATIESQKAAVREHAIKLGGELSEDFLYAEALSSTKLSYRQRPKIMQALDDAKHGLFHKLLVNEFGRLARKQIEQAVLIEMFKEYGVEVISCTEHFEDSPTGNFLRAAFSFNSEMEALKITERTSRGKRDRARLGKRLLGMGSPGYGYKWADATKSAYAINDTIFYTDLDGTEWSEYSVVVFIFDRLDEGWALRRVRDYLLQKGIPTRRGKPVWGRQTIRQIAQCPNYTGKAVAFRWQKVDGCKHMVLRDEAETIPLPDGTIPAIVSVEQFERIKKQFAQNKQDSIRNSKFPESNLMRAGLLKCGVCGRNCQSKHPAPNKRRIHMYECFEYNKQGERHALTIAAHTVDDEAWSFAKEHIRCPQLVLDRAASIVAERKETNDRQTITKSLNMVKKKITNLLTIAEDATDKEELADIRIRIGGLQREKRGLEKMLIEIANEDEKRQKIDRAIGDFLTWCEKVRAFIDDPDYIPTYAEKRRALVILGITGKLYPSDAKERFVLDLAPPSIMEALIETTFLGEYTPHKRSDGE